jgi:hypothetical protein
MFDCLFDILIVYYIYYYRSCSQFEMCMIYLLLDVKQYTTKQSIKQTAIDNYNDKYVTFVFIE